MLGRDITVSILEDLGALDALKLGIEQVLPERDHVDRPVACVMCAKDWSIYKDKSKVRNAILGLTQMQTIIALADTTMLLVMCMFQCVIGRCRRLYS